MGEHQFDNAPIEVKKISKITGYDLDMKPIEVTVWEEVWWVSDKGMWGQSVLFVVQME